MEWKSLNTAASPHRRIINAINIQHDFPHFYFKWEDNGIIILHVKYLVFEIYVSSFEVTELNSRFFGYK